MQAQTPLEEPATTASVRLHSGNTGRRSVEQKKQAEVAFTGRRQPP